MTYVDSSSTFHNCQWVLGLPNGHFSRTQRTRDWEAKELDDAISQLQKHAPSRVDDGVSLVIPGLLGLDFVRFWRFTNMKEKVLLGGGFKYFFFSPLLGEDSHFD